MSNTMIKMSATTFTPVEEDLGVLKLQLQETFDTRLTYKLKVKQNDPRA